MNHPWYDPFPKYAHSFGHGAKQGQEGERFFDPMYLDVDDFDFLDPTPNAEEILVAACDPNALCRLLPSMGD